MEDNFEWELTTKDGRKLPVAAEKASIVKRRWEEKQPIHFANESINYHDIVSFNKTKRRPVDVPLLEGAAVAFDEPIVTEDGIKTRWVKMAVSQREFATHYSKSPGYKNLGSEDGIQTVAFQQPIHQMTSNVELCTEDELRQLTM